MKKLKQFQWKLETRNDIRGQTSGAEATIISVDLISDEVGSLTGSFKVPIQQ